MTVFLDTSALLKRYVDEPGTETGTDVMALDAVWAASAIARAEAELALCHLLADEDRRKERVERLRRDWERFYVVAVDPECLQKAVEIGCEHDVRTLDAIHLGAAARLSPPVTLLTFDARQAAAAAPMGLSVLPEPQAAAPAPATNGASGGGESGAEPELRLDR